MVLLAGRKLSGVANSVAGPFQAFVGKNDFNASRPGSKLRNLQPDCVQLLDLAGNLQSQLGASRLVILPALRNIDEGPSSGFCKVVH